MIPLKKTIYILSFLFIANFASGQDNLLTLSTALEQALENNYGLIISKASLDVQKSITTGVPQVVTPPSALMPPTTTTMS